MKTVVQIILVAVSAAGCGWAVGRLDAVADAVPAAEPGPVEELVANVARHAVTGVPKSGAPIGAAAPELAVPAPCIDPGRRAAPEFVVARIANGTEVQRLEALNTALEYDVELPPGLLVETYERAGSEELRLLAFERHIDSLAAEAENARAAMMAATGSDSAAVRAEATRRLDQLAAYEAMLVAAPAGPGARP